ncbi:hypothetical protein 7865G3C7_41 [Haloquadratum phage sp.]|nr:hypothetical protein 7865G3C7_41 [Haloquadratum phage sp.]
MGFSKVKVALYAYVRTNNHATRDELQETFGFTERSFFRHIAFLRENDLLEHNDEKHRYEITERGKNLTFAGLASLSADHTDIFAEYTLVDDGDTDSDDDSEPEPETETQTVEVIDDDAETNPDPDPSSLTERERYIAGELQTGASIESLADEINSRESVIQTHINDLQNQGWEIYQDESTDEFVLLGDSLVRSSEHKGTRTRKANRWWEMRHNELVREYKKLSPPTTNQAELIQTEGEDWVTHMTDLHAGDKVKRDDGQVIYETDDIPPVIEYITEQSLTLADKHGSFYDRGILCWGGDFLTNEGIYEGQFEDLDAWLDEQHDALISPLIDQLRAFAKRFPTVDVICQVGNHGNHRASGTSRQANADLILYKTIRNIVAQLQQHGDELQNIEMKIGQAEAYRNFELRNGKLRGHLRHGQHRTPQAQTSARKKEWLSTLRDHKFDVALMGHHHISGRIPWDGPPIISTSSPKPAGGFVEKLGERVDGETQDMATAFGVSDAGITSIFPIDSRRFS